MNTLDLIVYLVLLLALYEGWRRGLILQLCSLGGIVVAIWLAARYGVSVGEWLRMDQAVAQAGGFAVVLVVTILLVALVGRLLRKLFHFAGFGLLDVVLGIAIALVKYLLLLSVAFAALDNLNADYGLVGQQTVEQSRWYLPVRELSDRVFPFLDRVGEQLPPAGHGEM